jgi:nicotinamidase-related amidase
MASKAPAPIGWSVLSRIFRTEKPSSSHRIACGVRRATTSCLQLRKRRIGKIILGGMLANMCVESHLRELLEQGFEVAVAKDATAAPKHPEWGYGYTAALINYAYLAHAVWTTDEAVKAMDRS